MQKGVVYWITGLSGAGKTTIGNSLYYELRKKHENVVILDGDILKSIIGQDLGYSLSERHERAQKYSRLCQVLADQGIIVVICTIAMFDDVREWNRKEIDRYIEIFLDVDLQTLEKRNQKNLYSSQKKGKISNVVGVDMETQYPKHPDLKIINDGRYTIEECVEKILNIQNEHLCKYGQDTNYWNQYYKSHPDDEHSLFAEFVYNEISCNGNLLELGCGNGRDSLYFAGRGINVWGIDESDVAINMLNQKNEYNNAIFICDDFVKTDTIYQKQFDYIYSRFTLHAITRKQENVILKKAYYSLKQNGKLFIEARTIRDELFGKGIPKGDNAFIFNEHYRRFIDPNILTHTLQNIGFSICYKEESNEFSPKDKSKPMLIRLVAEKRIDEAGK